MVGKPQLVAEKFYVSGVNYLAMNATYKDGSFLFVMLAYNIVKERITLEDLIATTIFVVIVALIVIIVANTFVPTRKRVVQYLVGSAEKSIVLTAFLLAQHVRRLDAHRRHLNVKTAIIENVGTAPFLGELVPL